MKNSYVKSFLHRGLIFGGFGPIVTGIISLALSLVLDDISVSGKDMFVIISQMQRLRVEGPIL